MERRLAAILAADVVGYSRLIRADEEGTIAALKALRADLIDPLISKHNGRIVKLMGDGMLVEFASVVDAVRTAVETQAAVAKHNAGLPEDERIEFRIGVNLGDVVIDGDDIQGDGVNVAARLEGIAEPGSICVSDKVYEEVRDRLEFPFQDLGEQEVKNIDRPMKVWRWSGTERAGSTVTGSEPPQSPDKPSIAVLPFDNMSGDPEQGYFSDGITEDLITELSRFRELSVISRSSSFVFKDKVAEVKEISEKLRAQYLVEGSIRKAGNRVRVTAQLIDAESDQHIWADRYDRELEDIFGLQDDIVRRVASTLVARLEHQRQERAKRQSKNELKAYDLYLRGREHFFNWSLQDNLKARDLLRSAIDLEPEYAAALALLSEVLLRMWLNGWSDDPDADLAESLAAAQEAVEIDDEDSRTHTALGMAYLFQRQLEKGKHHFETALTLNPNDTRVLAYFSRYAVFDGDTGRAIELCREALGRNPFGKYNWNLGLACFVARQYQETIRLLEGMRNPPENVLAILAASYAMTDDGANAKIVSTRFLDTARASPVLSRFRQPADWQVYFSARWPFRDPKNLDHLIGALGKAGLPV